MLKHNTNPFHQEKNIHALNFQFEKSVSTEDVDSAQAATATLHQAWLDIKSVDVSVQKGVSKLFSSGRAQKEKLEFEKRLRGRFVREALEKYHKQGESRKSDHQTDLTQVCQI